MKILTWNINSVRLRLPLLLKILDNEKPDVFCLQETKAPDEKFPVLEIVSAGYPYYHFAGMKSYNGVAIFSKLPLSEKEVYNRCGKEDCRHISVKINNKYELHNLYIPAGGDEPDVEVNEKFKHKLGFVNELQKFFSKNKSSDDKIIALGDFNIAPYENDVWSHKQLLKVVSHTPIEVKTLEKFRKSFDWIDVARKFVKLDEKLYSWWSYRARDWKKSNRGRRLDHIWVTPNLENKLKSFEILEKYRGVEKPSDHVPVVIELK